MVSSMVTVVVVSVLLIIVAEALMRRPCTKNASTKLTRSESTPSFNTSSSPHSRQITVEIVPTVPRPRPRRKQSDWETRYAHFSIASPDEQQQEMEVVQERIRTAVPLPKLASWKDDIYSRNARIRGKVSQSLHDTAKRKQRLIDAAKRSKEAK